MLLQYPCNWSFCCCAESNHCVWEIWLLKLKLITLLSRSHFLCSMSFSNRFKWSCNWVSVPVGNLQSLSTTETKQKMWRDSMEILHGQHVNQIRPYGNWNHLVSSRLPKSRSQCIVIGKGVQVGIKCIHSTCKNLIMGCQKWNFVSVRLERHGRIEIPAFHTRIVTW